MALNTEIRRVRLADLKPQKVNARFMTKDEYGRLVSNIRKDGCLTSVPLAYQPKERKTAEILSGHHRIKASIEALGPDVEADVMFVLDKQSLDELRARQLSHNSIVGQDDLAVLKQLWEEIDDVDWREYAALDDKTLDLLAQVDLDSLGEADLDFLTVQLLFLPHEHERAQAVFAKIDDLFRVDARYAALYDDWTRLVDGLDSVRGAHDVKNSAAAFTVLLDIVEAHLGDLYAGWYDEQENVPKHTKWIPNEALLGTRELPPDAATIIAQAFGKVLEDAELPKETPKWRALELLAANYLAGP